MASLNYIITGTRKGLGKELAEYYLAQGHNVAGCSRGKASINHNNYLHFELDVADSQPSQSIRESSTVVQKVVLMPMPLSK